MRIYPISTREYNKLLNHIDKTIKHDEEYIKIAELLINGLKGYEGKVINVRIEKVCKEILKGYSVHYSKRYERHELYVRSKTEMFDIDLTERTTEKNVRYSNKLLEGKIKIYKEKLKNDKQKSEYVTEVVSKYNVALKWFEDMEKELKDLPGWSTFNRFS